MLQCVVLVATLALYMEPFQLAYQYRSACDGMSRACGTQAFLRQSGYEAVRRRASPEVRGYALRDALGRTVTRVRRLGCSSR